MTRKINELSIPTDGLVLDLPLDGNANARVGSDGTATNVTWTAAERGYVSEVGSFNGSSSYITRNENMTGLTEVSVSCFFTTTANNTGGDRIFSWTHSGTTDDISFYESEGNIFFKMDDGTSTAIEAINNPVDGKIYHIVGTHNGIDMKVYVDGVEINSSAKTFNYSTASDNNLSIGRNINAGLYWEGKIGLVKIYNKALSQEEISSLYSEGLRKFGPASAQIWRSVNNDFPLYTPISLPTPVLEISKPQSGGTYYDQSGNGNNGTPTNVTDSAKGKYNVMSFNGTDSKLDTNYILSSTTSSISFHYTHTSGDDNFIISQGYKPTTLDGRWGMQAKTDNTLLLFQNPGNLLQITTSALTVGNTYLITINRTSNSDWELFVNGVSQGTTTDGIALPSQSIVFMELASSFKDGDIANIKINDTAITDKQIEQLYYSSFIPN